MFQHTKTIDATRVMDGKTVFIKRVPKGSPEISIIQYLSDPQLRGDGLNYTVPLLDFLVGDEDYDFLVMPLLRRFNDPRFCTLRRLSISYVRRLRYETYFESLLRFSNSYQGLAFLHEVGVAHRYGSLRILPCL